MNHEEIKALDEQVEKLEAQMDYIEDHYDAESPKSTHHSQWETFNKETVLLKMKSYQLTFPDAELQLHESGMQFRVINRNTPAPYGYSNN